MKIRHLRTKITFAFALLGLLPLASMGFLASWVVSVTHERDVIVLEEQALGAEREAIEKYLEGITSELDIKVGYSEKSVIKNTDQEFLLDKLIEQNSGLLDVSFIDLNGKETARKSKLQEVERVALQDFSQLEKFKNAAEGKTQNGFVQHTLQGPILSLATPVHNREGDVIMVISALVDLRPLVSQVVSKTLGNAGFLVLTDEKGKVIAGPQDLLGGSFYQEAQDAVSENTIIENTGWTLYASWPRADAFAIVRTIQYQVLGFTLGTLVLVFFGGWFLGRRILTPLLTLQKGAEKIGEGKFDEKIEIHTGDEIEELGGVFNKMEGDLKKLQELKVAEAKAAALLESLRKEKLLSQIKEDFINNTSHQLRTPLSVIRWSSELLAGSITDEKLKGIMEGVTAGVHELNSIVHDLITVSNFGFDYRNKINNVVDLSFLVARVKSRYEKQIAEKKFTWKESFSAERNVIGDPTALEILLENLIDNALTYTKEGGVIELGIEQQDKNILFTVKDSGIGITNKDQVSIFNQFFRATNAIVMKNVGTGLGLYICRLITEGHGGKIWFISKEEQGSTFFALLPAKLK